MIVEDIDGVVWLEFMVGAFVNVLVELGIIIVYTMDESIFIINLFHIKIKKNTFYYYLCFCSIIYNFSYFTLSYKN